MPRLLLVTYVTRHDCHMIKKSSTQSEQDTALQFRYGKIGIGAVAAAAPYQSGGKRPLRLPAIPEPDYQRSRRGNVGDQ